MTDIVEFCPECRHHHIPGPCDPNDLTEQGWDLYKALKLVTFPKRVLEPELKESQQ